MTPALDRLYYLLIAVADANKPCPSNSEIAIELEIVEDATVSQRISALRGRGFIKVSYGRWGRQIQICGTETRTVKQRRQPGLHNGHRVDSKRLKARLLQVAEEPDQDNSDGGEADVLGIARFSRDWDDGFDELELWLSRALAKSVETAA